MKVGKLLEKENLNASQEVELNNVGLDVLKKLVTVPDIQHMKKD